MPKWPKKKRVRPTPFDRPMNKKRNKTSKKALMEKQYGADRPNPRNLFESLDTGIILYCPRMMRSLMPHSNDSLAIKAPFMNALGASIDQHNRFRTKQNLNAQTERLVTFFCINCFAFLIITVWIIYCSYND